MSTDIKVWFSAGELSLLGERFVAGLPGTMRGCARMAKRKKWISREVPGRGGKGGIRTEYHPPSTVLALIQSFLASNPDFFAKSKTHTKADLATLSKEVFGDAPAALHAAREPAQPLYGFVFVPRYDVAASMGNGAVIHSEQVVDHLAFREEWVRTELGANPNNLVLISAIGDSMEPTLRAGDLLLIDRCTAGVKQDAIYAFATNGELRVKRMQLKIDGRVVVKSDNPQYDAEILAADDVAALRIIGRVVWSGRRM